MKKILCIACLLGTALLLTVSSHAQDDSIPVRNANNGQPFKEGGFRKENLFTGGV